MLSICDIVLNHTANETAWLPEHPEATYNARDCPHLRPAALLDAALARLTHDVARGALADRGAPPSVNRHEHLEAIRSVLDERLPALRLAELWQCDVTATVAQFTRLARAHVPPPPPPSAAPAPGALKLVPDPLRRRFAATVDLELALQLYNIHRAECADEESRVARCGEALRRALEELNDAAAARVQAGLRAATDNCIAGMRYFRLQADGPKISEVSERQPLVPRYFTWPAGAEALLLPEVEALVYGEEGARVMAHNGWVMNADPLEDFAAKEQDGKVYFRRELIAWGDSVKLRFGSRPEDSPFLWALMREYVELTAEIFDGVRLDNCHSTPLHVAEYLLDCARNVKPELYVVGELFTNADHLDNIYVNRLGITSLIREAQSAWDSHEQGRLVHRFGGRAVGAFMRRARRAAAPRVARAMLLDLTHDNPSPIDKRSVLDLLPTAALVSMACCATGSTRGYDELVPHHIHVVDEDRLYTEWEETSGGEGRVGLHSGIIAAKRALNNLHLELAKMGYSEVYVDQMDTDTVAVTRHHPIERRSVILVARTCFHPPTGTPPPPRDLRFEGTLDEIILEAEMLPRDQK
ncbi:hypothetical protein O0L34_g14322 [Tuta absoluta]|nr:hypothetical protein O0L34_g14322 [Tuta absoluta]